MNLYNHPGACSLSSKIALREAGWPFETEDVDLETKRTAGGDDFTAINPKGYVPALHFYLYVMLLWAERFSVDVPANLVALRRRLDARPAVQAAQQAEGLRLPEYS